MLKPIWKKRHEITGEWIFGLTAEDLAKVEAGFACHRCLEEFVKDGLPTALDECPVCHEPPVPAIMQVARELLVVVPTPDGW
jgi:hypothetical protein